MNPEIKAEWVAALRSGEYRQGRGALRDGNKYCCLGVLCDLAVKRGVTTERQATGGQWGYYGPGDTCEEMALLPDSVRRWAGLLGPSPALLEPVSHGEHQSNRGLVNLNDGGAPFSKIADEIERQL